MGLDIYLKWKGMTKKDKEARYTGFANAGSVGYLRSSYNEGGFNSWAKRYIEGKDFYYIFQPKDTGDAWIPTPEEWDEMAKRAEEALQLALKAKDLPYLIGVHFFIDTFETEADCLKAYLEDEALHKGRPEGSPGFEWYSNHKGEFFMEKSPTVMAVMNCKNVIGGKEVVLVCKPEKETHQYYIDLLTNDVPSFIKLGKEKNAKIEWSG